MKKILLAQLACFGDCLYATAVAKQIKQDYPACMLTWAVAGKYKSALEGNPYIDEIWEVSVPDNDFYNKGWDDFEAEALRRKAEGVYDEFFFTQIPRKNWRNFNGTIRGAILNGYDKPITVDVTPVLRLSEKEVSNVKAFVAQHNLSAFKAVILFECAPSSGQSFVNIDFALRVSKNITAIYPDVCFILSTHQKIDTQNPRIIDASSISFRENAELVNHCTLLLGCSSGITWLSTSDWVHKKIHTVQILSEKFTLYTGMEYDHAQWGLPTKHIIELADCPQETVETVLKSILDSGFGQTKQKFHQIVRPSYFNFLSVLRQVIPIAQNKQEIWDFTTRFYERNKHLDKKRLNALTMRDVSPKWYKLLKRLFIIPKAKV
jgi:hypothetical protein